VRVLAVIVVVAEFAEIVGQFISEEVAYASLYQ